MQLSLGLAWPSFRVSVLGSGSSGNSVVIESGTDRVLVDAGFSCRELERRLDQIGVDPDRFEAILLTHEHGDHVRGVRRFCKRHRTPVWGTEGTLEASGLRRAAAEGEPLDLRPMTSGRAIELRSFSAQPFSIPHDATEPVGLVLEDRHGRRAGVVGDLGMCSRLAWSHMQELDILILEANHDLEMLRNGPYPWSLKQRVAGRHGHLSNREAAEGLREIVSERLRWVVPYHLSRTNNHPALATEAFRSVLTEHGSAAEICVSEQAEPSRWLEV